jgi:competence protein ComEC
VCCVHAIFIQTPAGQQILVDGGPDPDKLCLELGKRLPFYDKSLDLVVLTHPEADHITGLVEVLKRYKVGRVLEYDGQQIEGFHSSVYDEWLRLIEETNIKRTIAQAGQQIELDDGIRIEVLHPPEELLEGTDSDTNNNSVVLRLEWNEVSFLLTGDIEEEAEREILHQGYKLNSTVLKVGHHGSSTSTSEQFLSAVDPEIAVISVGENNPFGHPSDEVVNRLKEKLGKDKVYLTSEHGTITFATDGERLWVKTER